MSEVVERRQHQGTRNQPKTTGEKEIERTGWLIGW